MSVSRSIPPDHLKRMSSHTPGPWSYAPAVPGAQRSFYISGNQDANNREVDIGTVQGGYYSCEANARLIAAAPDLLASLKRAVAIIDNCIPNDFPQWKEEALSAIAKAEAK